MSIEQLNQDHGIAGQLKFVAGKNDFPMIEIETGKARATISIYGGQVLSFQPVDEPEAVLFRSENAYYREGKAIKGGAPVCWPWFGPDPEGVGRPSHGFVRNRLWQVLSTEVLADGDLKVVLGVTSNAETRALWPYEFEVAIAFTISTTLTIELITRNTGDQAFTITQALHTYFTIGDVNQVAVHGLGDTRYIDKVDQMAQKAQTGPVTIASEVDRVYMDVPPELVIADPALGRRIRITSQGSKTAIVWNPWIDISTNMADLGDQDYLSMICVETANAADDIVEVAAHSEYRLSAQYSVERA